MWSFSYVWPLFIIQGKKLPANLDPAVDEGDVSDEDTGDDDDDDDEEDDTPNNPVRQTRGTDRHKEIQTEGHTDV